MKNPLMPLDGRDPPKFEVPRGTVRGLFLGPRVSAKDRGQILSWETGVPLFDIVLDERGMIVGFEEAR